MRLKNLKKDKKGLASQIMIIIVMALVIGFIILLIFLGQLVFPPLVSVSQDANVILQDTFQASGDSDLQAAGEASFQPAADSLNNLEWVSYTMVIIMFLVFLVMCFYVRTYPFLMFIWIILIILMLILSIYLAVVYQDLAADPALGDYYTDWKNTDFVLQNLPFLVVILGIAGGIIMFILSSRDQEAEIGTRYL